MTKRRKPRAFDLPDDTTIAPSAEAPKQEPTVKKRKPRTATPEAVLVATPDEAAQRLPPQIAQDMKLAEELTPPVAIPKHRRFGWGKLFLTALGALISLAIGLWVDQLIRDLFARQDWLGWLAVALTGLLFFAALAVTIRELWGLRRMARIDDLRGEALVAIETDDAKAAKTIGQKLLKLYNDRADMKSGRDKLSAHLNEIIDGADLVQLAERDLMTGLDAKATKLVMASAKRVSFVTAVSPRALIDVGYVLVENTRLIRALADLYGGRPGTLSFWRLARNVVGHLAVTGSIAIGDGLVQQLVGHGIAAKLSSRLGEGVVNGLLTARIGISAIDICRPLPFSAKYRPTVGDFMGELTRFTQQDEPSGRTEAKR
ncbi:YcjF family protein [Ahrensia sp. R2A130]|uniref:YcjF family protein n=1 Tax=Ahrensia sp. R2A130 TaxID=744979 RepID=UPI0001E0F062|nr:TIGR01620 family protein [Ahrensia sp. R2A130]EFL90412.1 membrane protein [Ahrensia sp. R2A130]